MPEGVTANVQQIIDSVEKLTVLELSELIKALEDHFGVSASAPMMMAAPAAGAAGGEEAAEEKTTFTPMLAEVGGEKIKVIKEVRAHTSMGLKEAKGFVEGDLPAAIKEDVSKEEAEDIKKKFEAVGAKVTIK